VADEGTSKGHVSPSSERRAVRPCCPRGYVDTPREPRIFRSSPPARWSCRHAGPTFRITVIRDVIVIASPTLVFVGTVLRMWDSLAEADRAGEFLPRTTSEEIHRLFIFFTLLDRVEHAVPPDLQLYYLRTAQGWFFLAVGTFGALLLAIGHVISS